MVYAPLLNAVKKCDFQLHMTLSGLRMPVLLCMTVMTAAMAGILSSMRAMSALDTSLTNGNTGNVILTRVNKSIHPYILHTYI